MESGKNLSKMKRKSNIKDIGNNDMKHGFGQYSCSLSNSVYLGNFIKDK